MGQGYSMTALSAVTVSIDVPELSDLTIDKTLSSARFMKSVRAKSQNGYVFVKAVPKPFAAFEVRQYVKQIMEERNILANIPNCLGFQRIIEVSNAGYLVRQHMFSSAYDRLSTRPFLEDIERRWLAFQLLCAVRDCHARKIHHGDIKTENLLVTSWNWLYLTDFSSSFKPTMLPEDNPADFSFYFDTSGRRICYIAPERFTHLGYEDVDVELNWAMDMFSVGCTIAELFLEGPIFTLSQIFRYRSGEYNPEQIHLSKIEDVEVRDMILNMIDLDPESRYSAEQHLSFYKGTVFPAYFYDFLHQYMEDLTNPSVEHQVVNLESSMLVESDHKIDRVYQDFDKIAYFLNYHSDGRTAFRLGQTRSVTKRPAFRRVATVETNNHDGTLLFLTLVSSSVRSTAKASARLRACDLFVAFAERLPDEAKLDRVLPYLAGLLTDRSDMVKVAALQAVTAIMDTVEVVSPINAYLFPEYIFPRLKQFLSSGQNTPTPLVRAAYASCLASLAFSSGRMLDMVQAIRADGRMPALSNHEWAPDASYHSLYDVARAELNPHFEEATTALITDPDISVRRALLGSVARLCIFFGSSKSSDLILSHLNTYLNDRDWMLRCSFFEALVGVALYVGSSSLEKFILPIMVGSLTDQESFVVEKVFRSLSRMAALGLFQKSTTWELVSISSRFLVHPSAWIRESAIQLVAECSKCLDLADQYCIILPLIQPFLRAPVVEITEQRLLDQVKSPLSRSVFESALLWASRKDTSLFWTAAKRDGALSLSDPELVASPAAIVKKFPSRIPPSQRDKDDQTAIETLRKLGMTQDDEIKLLGLREYIWRLATQRTEDTDADKYLMMNNIMSLTQIGVTPQNVFFDQREPIREVRSRTERTHLTGAEGRHTLTDALLDASTTIDDPSSRRPPSLRPDANAATPPPSKPINIRGSLNSIDDTQIASSERPNPRLNTIRERDARRSSSVSTRHALLDSSYSLRHRGSALHLLSRTELVKADPEISTTPENAFGKLDGQTSKTNLAHPSTDTLTAQPVSKSRSRSPAGRRTPRHSGFTANHSYAGTDPYVTKMLENHFTENFPIDLLDFGQARASADAAKPMRRADDPAAVTNAAAVGDPQVFRNEAWRPTGQLLTQFSEHTAAINRVVAASDHAFFVTASDDGSCKIWDTTRLEKNITPRSRHTHRHAQGVKVKSLCFIENTHSFVSGGDDGSIHVVRVEYRNMDGGESTRYGKPQLVRDYQLPGTTHGEAEQKLNEDGKVEHAVWMYHYRTSTSQSILLVATTRSRILMMDMKTMDIVHSMENPIEHGTPTTFCIDRRHHWLLLGTTHGILDLWDLRFRLRLRAFGMGGAALGKRIDRLLVHPTKGHGRWVIVSAGGEISVWDIEKLVCREVFRPHTYVPLESSGSGKGYEAWLPDDQTSEKILEQFAKDVQVNETQLEPVLRRPNTTTGQADSLASAPPSPSRTLTTTTIVTSKNPSPASSNLPILALHTMSDYLHNPSQPDNPNKVSVLFSAGADRTIRYWDLPHLDQSFIVSGPAINVVGEENKLKVRYESSWPTSMSLSGLVMLVEEKVGIPGSSSGGGGGGGITDGNTPKSTPKKKSNSSSKTGNVTPARSGGGGLSVQSEPSTPVGKSTTSGSGTGTGDGGIGGIGSGSGGNTNKPQRSSLINAAQQQLLKTHLDTITDVVVLKRPYGMVVSVNRAGGVYIFH